MLFGFFPHSLTATSLDAAQGKEFVDQKNFSLSMCARIFVFVNRNVQWTEGVNGKTEMDSSSVMMSVFSWQLLGICMDLRKSAYEEVI